MQGMDAVIHTATLHKPHEGTHSRQAFVDTNISGTLNLLEAAVRHGIGSFTYTSTSQVFLCHVQGPVSSIDYYAVR